MRAAFYKCAAAKKKTCDKKAVRKQWLEDLVVNETMKLVEDVASMNAIQMGILTSSTKERLEALEEQRKELQARIAEERLAKPKMKEELVRFNRKGRFGIRF